jgi:hypothetical protein
MTPRKQAKLFSSDLDALVDRYVAQYDLTYYEIVGILHMAASRLEFEANARVYDEQDDIPPSPEDFLDDRKV